MDMSRLLDASGEGMLLFYLSWMTAEDIRKMTIQNSVLLSASICGILFSALRWTGGSIPIGLMDYLFLMLTVVLLHRFSRGQVGSGDLWTICLLPFYLSFSMSLGSLLGSFLMLMPAGILLWIEERNRKIRIPYLPFLWAGVCIQVIGNRLMHE